jgi:DNA-binding IclR family transcriptional regulator
MSFAIQIEERQSMAESEPKSGGEGVKSAQRALMVLELLTRSETPLSFAEIGAELEYPRSSLFGLLKTLQDRHWVALDEQTRRYSLGIRTMEAGNAYLRSIDLVQLAQPHMVQVRDGIEETVQLSVLDGRFNVYLGKVEGKQSLRLASEIGRRLEAHTTALGKMMLAGLSDDELNRLFAGIDLEGYTPHTITDFDQLKLELVRSRQRGYATDDEEHTRGVRCVALPIRNHRGQTVAGLSVSFPTVRYTDDQANIARDLLSEAVLAISKDLGYRPGQHQREAPSNATKLVRS